MAATTKWYGKGVEHVMEGRVDMDTDTFRASLHTATYTPNQDTDDFLDDATNECTGTGYTAGGVTLASLTGTYDAATNEWRWDAADISWTALNLATAARYLVISKSRGGAASADELVSYVDLGGDVDPNGNNLSVTWHANGILKAVVS